MNVALGFTDVTQIHIHRHDHRAGRGGPGRAGDGGAARPPRLRRQSATASRRRRPACLISL